jgi:hypothetical protein
MEVKIRARIRNGNVVLVDIPFYQFMGTDKEIEDQFNLLKEAYPYKSVECKSINPTTMRSCLGDLTFVGVQKGNPLFPRKEY